VLGGLCRLVLGPARRAERGGRLWRGDRLWRLGLGRLGRDHQGAVLRPESVGVEAARTKCGVARLFGVAGGAGVASDALFEERLEGSGRLGLRQLFDEQRAVLRPEGVRLKAASGDRRGADVLQADAFWAKYRSLLVKE